MRVVAVVQADGKHAQLRQGVQLVRLGDAVMIFVDPQEQVLEYVVAFIDNTVAVAAILWLIKFRQRAVAIEAMVCAVFAPNGLFTPWEQRVETSQRAPTSLRPAKLQLKGVCPVLSAAREAGSNPPAGVWVRHWDRDA
jgi:hypothetical protein